MIVKALLVGVGGFLGAVSRYALSSASKGLIDGFPVGTLLVNLLGSLIMGLLVFGFFQSKTGYETYRLLLLVGFCGSFTTMSTFAFDFVKLVNTQSIITSIIYLFANIAGAILMIYLAKIFFKAG